MTTVQKLSVAEMKEKYPKELALIEQANMGINVAFQEAINQLYATEVALAQANKNVETANEQYRRDSLVRTRFYDLMHISEKDAVQMLKNFRKEIRAQKRVASKA